MAILIVDGASGAVAAVLRHSQQSAPQKLRPDLGLVLQCCRMLRAQLRAHDRNCRTFTTPIIHT